MSPGGWCRTGTSPPSPSPSPRRRCELPYDLSCGLDARDAPDAFPRLPVVPRRRSGGVAALQSPRRIERVQRAHEMFGSAVSQQPAGDRAGPGAYALHVRRADHRERHAGDALGEHDVILVGLDDRALVVGVRRALGGGDETGAELNARVTHTKRCDKPGGVADPTGAHEGNTQVAQLIDQLLGAVRSRMPAGPAVHGDQTTYPGVEPLEGPL